MKISKLQRSMLEKLWRESNKVSLQLVADILNIRIRFKSASNESVEPLEETDNEIIKKLLTKQLLDHLNEIRKISRIKTENLD